MHTPSKARDTSIRVSPGALETVQGSAVQMVVSSIEQAEFDSPEAAGPANAHMAGLVIGGHIRCEIMYEERIARSAVLAQT
jgi:hypothetical protein